MGTSNSQINCCDATNNTEIVKAKHLTKKLLNAYESFKRNALFFKKNGEFKEDFFLIGVKSINEFMKNIKNSNVLNDLSNNNNIEENESLKKLENNFNNYKLEKNIEIYYDFEKCQTISKDPDEKIKQFIIVDEEFASNMNIENYKGKKVKLDVNKKLDERMRVIFDENNNHYINFKEISFGIFSFINTLLYHPNQIFDKADEINNNIMKNINNNINNMNKFNNISNMNNMNNMNNMYNLNNMNKMNNMNKLNNLNNISNMNNTNNTK